MRCLWSTALLQARSRPHSGHWLYRRVLYVLQCRQTSDVTTREWFLVLLTRIACTHDKTTKTTAPTTVVAAPCTRPRKLRIEPSQHLHRPGPQRAAVPAEHADGAHDSTVVVQAHLRVSVGRVPRRRPEAKALPGVRLPAVVDVLPGACPSPPGAYGHSPLPPVVSHHHSLLPLTITPVVSLFRPFTERKTGFAVFCSFLLLGKHRSTARVAFNLGAASFLVHGFPGVGFWSRHGFPEVNFCL